ncbi:MAG: DUF4230 domain-containing protein [Treponema sp.]|jgi:hypothetical protein|nr:DUF4230 domain-containing protein [Treponema sp.]
MESFNVSLALILAIIAVIAVVVGVFLLKNNRGKTSSVIILNRIREINEYASHEISYFGNVSHAEQKRIWNHAIPLTKKGFSINMQGKIRIGINMDHAEFSIQNRNLYITIPEIKILSHETEITEVVFQTHNLLNPQDYNDYKKKVEEMKTKEEENILQNSALIEEVYNDLKKKMTNSLLAFLGFSKYKIHYKTETPVLLVEKANLL